MDPKHFGTRHRSLFAYCYANPDSLGFVISQDGEIRAVMKVGEELVIWEHIKVHQFLKSKKILPLSSSKT
jgi:DNA integrity scanning protein DisA with diadenylate cyclase activity